MIDPAERDRLAGLSDLELETEAQRAGEAHLGACEQAMYETEETGEEADSSAGGLFCGCRTCVVREVLQAAWPPLLELARRELAADPQRADSRA